MKIDNAGFIKCMEISSDDEVLSVLSRLHSNKVYTKEMFISMIERGYRCKDEQIFLYLVEVFSENTGRFITESIPFLTKTYDKVALTIPNVSIHGIKVSEPLDFTEKVLCSLGVSILDDLFKAIDSCGLYLKISYFKVICNVLDSNRGKIAKDIFNEYVLKIIDCCIDNYDIDLIKFEVCKFLSKTDLEESVLLLRYIQTDNHSFNLRYISSICLENVNKGHKIKPRNNENLKSLILGRQQL